MENEGNRTLMLTIGLNVCHPREGGDPEDKFFQALKAQDKRKVNLPARSRVLDFHVRIADFGLRIEIN